MTTPPQLQTTCVRAGIDSDTQFGAVIAPLYLSSNFTFADIGQPRAHDYTRSGNPTRDQLAGALAQLEGGAGAVVTSTGMSAIHVVTSLLERDDLLIAPADCYGGTHRQFTRMAQKGHFRLRWVDMSVGADLERVLNGKPAMIWVETPSNPLTKITDIARVSQIAKRCGASVVVDNTFLSPALSQPLGLGANYVVHSTTKYLNGHSDVVGGAVIADTLERSTELAWWANTLGVTGSPFDSYLTLRGLRTLHARMRSHCHNARALLNVLVEHPHVEAVHHPSAPQHPGRQIAAQQQSDAGPMFSFELRGGRPAVRTFVDRLKLFSLAESLGGVESLVAHPQTMTHAAMDPEARQRAGISDGLVRISVGIEDSDDLVRDLRAALDQLG